MRCLGVLCALLTAALPSKSLDARKALTQYAHRIWGQEQGLFQPTIYSILQTQDGFLWLGTQDSLIRFDGVQFHAFDGPGAGGLHDTLIRALMQDGRGNLWVGSLGAGLGKIAPDGRLTRYTTASGLPTDNVFCLDSGGGDQIWVCTTEGLSRFENGPFRTYKTADG